MEALRPVLNMTDRDMLDLIPAQSGLHFVGCLHCTGGQQERQLTVWDVARPDRVACAFCGHIYPSAHYPMDQVQEVFSPNGQMHPYPYHASRPSWWTGEEPYRSYFAARIDYHRIRYMEHTALRLAQAFAATGEREHARRAALILQRFAQVYPGYCYHYDFPFRQKIIYTGHVQPESFRKGFRTARWTWWAYQDISRDLLTAYELIRSSSELARLEQETGAPVTRQVEPMFGLMAEQILGNRDDLTNMSPGMWAALIHAGRALGEPRYVHSAIARLQRFLTEQFFYDGAWREGTPSYHRQVVGGLQAVFTAAAGYTDPPGYTHPKTGARYGDVQLETDLPQVARATQALLDMRLPNGRYAPVHDTWWTDGATALEASRPMLLPGLGHGVLGAGTGADQVQAHLTWSPGYGHQHCDGLSLLLFARGHELLSDIGYTHTRWREWAIASASHNLVVVDATNQQADPTTHGHLRYFDARRPACQLLSVDNPQVYPRITNEYRRTLVLVQVDGADWYVVDLFAVHGGSQHDYFLHGSADEAQDLSVSRAGSPVTMEALATLVPEDVEFTFGETEQTNRCGIPGLAYGYLRDLRRAPIDAPQVVQLDYALPSADAGLRAWCVTQPGDELVVGTNPAIRQAGSDDSQLDQHRRSFALLRRRASASLFAALIEPHGGQRRVQRVDAVELPGAGLALQVTTHTRCDLIVVNARQARGQWQAMPLTADAELAVLRGTEAATVVHGSCRWGELEVATSPVTEYPLLAVDRSSGECSLLLEGEIQPPAGSIAVLDQAGERTSAYEVASATTGNGRTRLILAIDPGIEFDAATQTSTFVTLPLSQHTGGHAVRMGSVAHSPDR